jgi:hypothetical protein
MDNEQLTATLVDFDQSERPHRVERLHEVNQMLGDQVEEGFLHSGGPEASWILSEARECYIYGLFIASLFTSHAACERRLAGMVSMASGDQPPEGFDRWGLGKLVEWCAENGWITDDFTTRLSELLDKRKQLAHFRMPFQGETSILRRVAKAATDEEWTDNLGALLQADARDALRLAYDVYYGLSGIP